MSLNHSSPNPDPNRPEPNRNDSDPLLAESRLSAVRYFLEELANLTHPIQDPTLRKLLLATIELRSANPQLMRHDSEIKALGLLVSHLNDGISDDHTELDRAASILEVLYQGAAGAVAEKKLEFNQALYLLNGNPTEQRAPSEAPPGNGFDFAIQYGSANYTVRELFDAFDHPNRDLMADQLCQEDIILIELFQRGFRLIE